jgi:hypothetical protein
MPLPLPYIFEANIGVSIIFYLFSKVSLIVLYCGEGEGRVTSTRTRYFTGDISKAAIL